MYFPRFYLSSSGFFDGPIRGRLVCRQGGGAYLRVKTKGKWDDRQYKTEWKSLFENEENVSYFFIYSLIEKIFDLRSYHWLKNRNPRVHPGGYMRGGRAYTWSNTSDKGWAYLRGPIQGGRKYIGGEIRYV